MKKNGCDPGDPGPSQPHRHHLICLILNEKRGPADPGRALPGPVLRRSILKAWILTLGKFVTFQRKTWTNAGGEGAASHGPRVLLLFAHIYQHLRHTRHSAHCFPRMNRHRILPGRHPGLSVLYTGKHRIQGNGNNSPPVIQPGSGRTLT